VVLAARNKGLQCNRPKSGCIVKHSAFLEPTVSSCGDLSKHAAKCLRLMAHHPNSVCCCRLAWQRDDPIVCISLVATRTCIKRHQIVDETKEEGLEPFTKSSFSNVEHQEKQKHQQHTSSRNSYFFSLMFCTPLKSTTLCGITVPILACAHAVVVLKRTVSLYVAYASATQHHQVHERCRIMFYTTGAFDSNCSRTDQTRFSFLFGYLNSYFCEI
jgi:hypothetical protein